MTLEPEIAYFAQNLQEWLRHYRGQFALVKGARLAGTFTTFAEAYEAGVREFGLEPFLVKVLTDVEEQVQYPALAVGVLNARL
jgi:hypothetical protein